MHVLSSPHLLMYLYNAVGTHSSAASATYTFLFVNTFGNGITHRVNTIAQSKNFFRASSYAKPAPLTQFFVEIKLFHLFTSEKSFFI